MQDQSFGVIPVRHNEGLYELYIVKHKGGYWSFPKGHPIGLETPLQTAKRELFEETGLSVEKLIVDIPLIERYSFAKEKVIIHKTVGYFVAFVSGNECLQQEEVIAGKWVHLELVEKYLTYQESKELAKKAAAMIHTLTTPLTSF